MIKRWNGGGSLLRSAGGSLPRSSGGCLERSSGGYLSGISNIPADILLFPPLLPRHLPVYLAIILPIPILRNWNLASKAEIFPPFVQRPSKITGPGFMADYIFIIPVLPALKLEKMWGN